MPERRRHRPIILSARATSCLGSGTHRAGAHAADPSKILRITFQAAETGFDPVKVSDYYSGTVIEAIFDPLLTYDYLARPAKLVPNTAAALPQVTDQGRTYRVTVKPGIHFADDPVFKGAKRELTALDYAYSLAALPRPEESLAVRVPVRRDRRDRDARPLHAGDPPEAAGFQFLARARVLALGRGGARGDRALRRRVGGETGGQRTVPPQELHALLEDRARGESGLPRGDARRRAAAAHRRRRDQHHGRDAEPLARVPARRHRHRVPARRGGADLHHRRRPAQAGVREARHQARAQRRSGDHLPVLQHAGQDGRRPLQGEDRAAARDRHGLQGRGPDPHHPQGPVDPRAVPDPAWRRRPRPGLPQQHRARPARGQRAARQVRLQQGRRRLPPPAERRRAGASAIRPRRASATASSTS